MALSYYSNLIFIIYVGCHVSKKQQFGKDGKDSVSWMNE